MKNPEEKRLQFAAETVMDCLFGRYRPGFVDAKNIVNSERRGGRKEVGGVLDRKSRLYFFPRKCQQPKLESSRAIALLPKD